MLRVWEELTPPEEEFLERILLTSVPMTTLDEVWEQVEWYKHRWVAFEDIIPSNLSSRAKPKQDEETRHYLPNGVCAKSGLNKSIVDAGWHHFISLCQYIAAEAVTVEVVKVDPRYTSQICSVCGTVRKKILSERWHSCNCGRALDRDHNAIRNIKALRLGRSPQEAQAS